MSRLTQMAQRSGSSAEPSSACLPTMVPSSPKSTTLGVRRSPSALSKLTGRPWASMWAMTE